MILIIAIAGLRSAITGLISVISAITTLTELSVVTKMAEPS